MKKHIYTVTIMAVLAGIYHFGCTSAAKEHDTTTTMQSTKFDGAQGDCTNGGVKIEVLLNGVVDGTQTQYICNGTQGENGQSGTSTSIKTTKFDGAQGDCTNGGVKIELLVNGVVDSTQTQYNCNSAAQGGIFCNGIYRDSMHDSANCGSCGNVCQAGFECVNSTCKRITDMNSSTTITCNAQTVKPYTDNQNCSGCGIACNTGYFCKQGSCQKTVVGDIIVLGHYEQDNNTTNGKEPIEWRVLDINAEGQYLVISDKVLEAKKYNEIKIPITWEKSTLRSWLNGYFIEAAFTAEEQAKIIAPNVPAHKNPRYITSPGNATTDKIFLLSIVEVQQYFANDTARLADATRYAVKQGVLVRGTDTVSTTGGTYPSYGTCTNIHYYALWWLRSPGYPSYAAYVNRSGAVSTSGDHVNNDYYGVRPALWLDY